MKKNLKIWPALLLAAWLLAVTAAAEPVKVQNEDEFLKAIDNLCDEVILENTIPLSGPIVIDYDMVLNLNGYMLTIQNLDICGGAAVTIRNGTISGLKNCTVNIYGSSDPNKPTTVTAEEDSTIDIGGGIRILGEKTENGEEGTNGSCYVELRGKVTSKRSPCVQVSNKLGEAADVTVKINGAELQSGKETSVKINGCAQVLIDGADITGTTGIVMRAGEVRITNSSIKGTGDAIEPAASKDGNTGDAILLEFNAGFPGGMKLQLGEGNTISSTNGYALRCLETGDNPNIRVSKITVTGGTFSGRSGAVKLSEEIKAAAASPTGKVLSVKGGTFTSLLDEIEPFLERGRVIDETGTVVSRSITVIPYEAETEFLSGAGQTVAAGSAASFRIDLPLADLKAVAVDGIPLDSSRYRAWEGSTCIELLGSFTRTLSEGLHTLSVHFDGATAETTFTVSNPSIQNPKTGAVGARDTAMVVAAVSVLGAAVLLRKKTGRD